MGTNSNLIQRYRTSRGLSQADLARAVNLSVNYISLLERGLRNPSAQTLQALADVFNVGVGDMWPDASGDQVAKEMMVLASKMQHSPEIQSDWLEIAEIGSCLDDDRLHTLLEFARYLKATQDGTAL